MRLFERNIFVIETFALSPLIPELYWFSWESLWSIFWLWSMVLLAYLLDDSLMWTDFQVYIKDASFREEHFCHWNLRSISPHPWVILILVRKPLKCFWYWSMVLLAYLSTSRPINKLEGPWIINKKYSKGFLTRINTTQEWEEIERKFQWQKCFSRKDASFIKNWKSAHINESSNK